MKINDRLLFLKGSRHVSAWERSAGIARGNLDRAIKDGHLSDENIIKLRQYENLNVNWLLCGDGSPYQYSVFPSDVTLSEQLQAHCADEVGRWALTVVQRKSDLVFCAVVLSMPGQYLAKAKDIESWIDYSIIEVLCGPIGHYCFAAILGNVWAATTQLLLDDHDAARLCTGFIGSYELTKDPGILMSATAVSTELFDLQLGLDEDETYQTITDSERVLVQNYRKLTSADKARLSVIARAFLTIDN